MILLLIEKYINYTEIYIVLHWCCLLFSESVSFSHFSFPQKKIIYQHKVWKNTIFKKAWLKNNSQERKKGRILFYCGEVWFLGGTDSVQWWCVGISFVNAPLIRTRATAVHQASSSMLSCISGNIIYLPEFMQ